jgi:hypothetical protein
LHIPSKGDRVEQTRCGIRRTGTVWYADQLQVLIKWDDGGSSSLPVETPGLTALAPRRNGSRPEDLNDALRPRVPDQRSNR